MAPSNACQEHVELAQILLNVVMQIAEAGIEAASLAFMSTMVPNITSMEDQLSSLEVCHSCLRKITAPCFGRLLLSARQQQQYMQRTGSKTPCVSASRPSCSIAHGLIYTIVVCRHYHT